jgi:uncharacterized membrane protein
MFCKSSYVLLVIIFFSANIVSVVSAQEVLPDRREVVKAKVTAVLDERVEIIETTNTQIEIQTIQAKILRGDRKGEVIEFMNDFEPVDVGIRFFLNISTTMDGREFYSISDFERRPWLLVFFGLFMALVIGFGKWQGVRSLVSLGVSMLAIFLILVPLLVKGYSPILVSTVIAAVVLFFAIFFTHGFNRNSAIAFSGTMIAVIITGLLAVVAVVVTKISGFASHEAVYLDFNTGGLLDFRGLFLASVIIGMLGVLDDISITQVAVVRELYAAGKHMKPREIFDSAIRVGKEHVSALVNTLVLAYIGVSLPAVMYFSTSYASAGELINMEIFAAEIIRTILGSIGLILTVPIATFLAVVFLKKTQGKPLSPEEQEHGHSHPHSHGGGHVH